MKTKPYTIMGITGQVGGAVARALLKDGKKVRGIVRDRAKAASWEKQGVELAVADYDNPSAMESAFRDTEGAFVMIVGNFAPSAGFPETREILATLRRALDAARPPKAVYLSSVGAQHPTGLGLITQLNMLEKEFSTLPFPNAFVRAGWFLANFQWDIESARNQGEIASFLSPLDRKFPMVSTEDIGELAAKILQQEWSGNRYPEIEGPGRYSFEDAAEAFSRLLNRSVRAVGVPRENWASLFEQQGTPADRTAPRIEMLDGFNSGRIDFDPAAKEHFQGRRSLEENLRGLLKK
jgi:NAD(P)H dehydrogenase (quinone)